MLPFRPAGRRDSRRPPRHRRFLSRGNRRWRRWPWRSVWPGRAMRSRAEPVTGKPTACSRGSAASCTGALPGAGMHCSSCAMRCCAGRSGCTCWRSCPWSRSAAAATARSMTRSTRGGSRSRGCAGRWRAGDPDIVVIFDAGYDLTRLAWLLADLPVEVLGRLRSDRVMYFPAPPRVPGTNGRPLRHGAAFKLADQRSWPIPAAAAITETTRYGTARALARGRLHQQLAGRAGWEDHDGELPIVEGTLIRLAAGRLPGDRNPEPLWLWSSRAGTSAAEVDRAWQAFLRRFDIEPMFRFFKQALGWTRPKLRDPAAADRWTWILLACYAQLRLARHLAAGIRLPWQRPCPPGRLTPARVRRGFRTIRQALPCPASAPKPGKPGPGRPPGSKNRRPATCHDVGKTVKRAEPKNKSRRQKA